MSRILYFGSLAILLEAQNLNIEWCIILLQVLEKEVIC